MFQLGSLLVKRIHSRRLEVWSFRHFVQQQSGLAGEVQPKPESFHEDVRLEEALDLLEKQGIQADSAATYTSLLRRCGDEKALAEGRRVHAHIVSSGFNQDRLLGNLLVGMYGKCGSLEDARSVFESVAQKNMFSWTMMITAYAQNGYYNESVCIFQRMLVEGNSPDKFIFTVMISAHAQNGHPEEALGLFWQMHLEGVRPDTFTLTIVFAACSTLGALPAGKAIHASIANGPFESHLIVANCLITMYGKCGSLGDAKSVFLRMRSRDVVSWNALIAAYAQHGHSLEAFQIFQQMQQEGMKADPITFVGILDACTCLEQGKAVHALLAGSDFVSDLVAGNALLSMYGRCASLGDARSFFDQMPWRNPVSWCAMLTAYTQHGHAREAVKLAQLMNMEGVKPNRVTFLSLLAACVQLEDLEQGRLIHAGLISSGFPMDVVVETTLVNMYGKCGSLEDARRVLDRMFVRSVVSWNAMITAYAQHERGRDALELFRRMDLEGTKPSKITFVSVLDACASLGALAEGEMANARVIASGFDSDVDVSNAIVSMYGKCGSLENARKVFDEMQRRDVISWNSLVVAYSQHGYGKQALELFWTMDLEGMKPDKITFMAVLNACATLGSAAQGKAMLMHARAVASGFELGANIGNILINLYGKCGSVEDAKSVFNRMSRRDVVSWNAMLTVYVQHGCNKQALELFQRMDLQGVKPDEITFVLVLDACASIVAPAEGRLLHARAVANGFDSDDVVRNAIVNMYGKCGNLEAARKEFDKTHLRDVVSWTAMLAAYAQHGHAKEGLKLFWKMQQDGVKPDSIAFVCAVFACSHAGLMKEAFTCFVSMTQDYNLEPLVEHYGCIIDMLGRVGWLEEAEEFMNKMPSRPDVVSLRTLLGACAVHGDTERGARAAELIHELNPKLDGLYVLLSNMHATCRK